MFVIVTGPPCSGKSTYIDAHRRDGEPVFRRSGLDNDPAQVRRDRSAFVRAHSLDAGTVWVEARSLTSALVLEMGCSRFEERPMPTTYAECMRRLDASGRDRRDAWAEVIARWFRVRPSHGQGYDAALARRLTDQHEMRGHDRGFYNSAAWRALRASVLSAAHGECQDCLDRSPARYSPATCVHHEAHVDEHPGWALSETYVDVNGIEHVNLVALCHECHDLRHGRWQGRTHDTTHDLTQERW